MGKILSWVGILLGLGVSFWLSIEGFEKNQLKRSPIAVHWQETKLAEKDLFFMLDPRQCRSTQRQALACANAIIQMAQKMNFKVQPDGQLEPIGLTENLIFQTEKTWLQTWFRQSRGAADLDYLQIARNLLALAPAATRSYMVATGMNALFSVLRDPHTYLLPRSYYENVVMNGAIEQKSFGITMGKAKNKIVVRRLQEWSKAKNLLRNGDEVLEIQNIPILAVTQNRLSEIIREALSSELKLKIRRESRIFEVDLKAQTNMTKSVESKVFGELEKVGVIQINKFASETCLAVEKAIEQLKGQFVRGLIVDLRDNPGGSIEEAGCVVGLFVGPGKLAYRVKFFDPKIADEEFITSQSQVFEGRVAVLVNSNTASAGELLAGSLQDYKRGLVLGQRTYGKGTFQEGKSWQHSDDILIFETKGLYFLPEGQTPQLIGVEPNVQIALGESIQVREQEQYLFPKLNPLPERPKQLVSAMEGKFKACLISDWGSSINAFNSEDEQLNQGARVLNCQKQVYANSTYQTL